MQLEKVEGVVLHSLAYGDRGRIIKIFSKEKGLLSLIVKGLSQKKPMLFSLTTPLTHGIFWINLHNRNDLFPLQEASIVEDHFQIRQKASHLSSAIDMIQALLSSQMPGKPSEALFSLFVRYLHKIPSFEDPSCLSMSLLLKILLHDGLLQLRDHCSLCEEPAMALFGGECFCHQHAPNRGASFTKEEREQLILLAYGRSFEELQQLEIATGTKEKIKSIFLDSLH